MRANDAGIIVGKYTLESLTIGMYKDPFTIYREYIQNSTDSIDDAIRQGIIKDDEAHIRVYVDKAGSTIKIRDNGTGIHSSSAVKVLCDVGNSAKDYHRSRGFRGIGRLGGLGYAKRLIFTTSAKGDKQKTTISWDCEKLKELLQPGKYKEYDLLEVIKEITSIQQDSAVASEHYFEVQLQGIDQQFLDLLELKMVDNYLATVAPVPFDYQKFLVGKKIKNQFKEKRLSLEEYKITLNGNPNPICKRYTNTVRTGHQERSKKTDQIKDIEFFECTDNGKLVYFGWHAITSFYGSVSDEFMQGIRLRKGNILIGGNDTFSQFFPVEKDVANAWFIGEVYIFDNDIIPNARRDDFEKDSRFNFLYEKLSQKADELNRIYRRNMSKYNSSIKGIEESRRGLDDIYKQINNEGITSDARKEQLIEKKDELEKKIENRSKELQKVVEKYSGDNEKVSLAQHYLKEADSLKKKLVEVENKIINAEFSTKKDLPSSFTKEERKVYQIVIKVIDEYLDKDTAKEIRERIIKELTSSKKSKK